MDLVKQNGLEINPAPNEKLLAADDKPMQVAGSTRMIINGTQVRALVSSLLRDDCWKDIICLSIILPNFPEPQPFQHSCNQVVAPPTEEELTELKACEAKILEEFTDVLSDTCLLYTSPSPRDRG